MSKLTINKENLPCKNYTAFVLEDFAISLHSTSLVLILSLRSQNVRL